MNEFRVLSKQVIASNIKRMDILAPQIAQSARPGQFVLVMADAWSLRLALPVIETNPQKKTITIVFKEENPSQRKLGSLAIGQSLEVVMGPLGNPKLPQNVGVSVCIGYELGIAQMVPVSRYLHKQGTKNFAILGTATKRNLIMESQMRLSCHGLFVMSEDGSVGKKGFVTDALTDVLERYPVEEIFAAAPSAMIQETVRIVSDKKIKIHALLPPLALSGIGFCGSDEIRVNNEYVLLSIDGPIFDARVTDLNYYDARVKRSYG